MNCFRIFLFSIAASAAIAGEGWWMTEPVSLIQTNLRETDSGLDPIALVAEVKAFPANTILFSVGGITAHYPTNVEYHYRSDYLPEGKDLVGDVIKEAHQNGIRIIGRFDFSRTREEVYRAHPEWFFRRKNGELVFDDNGLYSICINGAYYSEKAIEILTEALERYEVDGLFFNWFGNIRSDYHGRDIGLCHCEVCQTRFRIQFGRSVPDRPDPDYQAFIFESAVTVAKAIKDLIREKRPNALFMTYIDEYTDGIVSEADFYKWRPLPQLIYSASEHVNRALNTHPDKMAFSLVMPYQEMRYRFGSTAGPGLRAFLYQNMAHGAFPAFVVLGTMDQPDKTALKGVRQVFQFFEKHKGDYPGQKNGARVILYASQDPSWSSDNDYRGFYRLLSELHVPFKVTNRVDALNPADIDLVLVPAGPTPAALLPFLEKGGTVLIAGTTHPGLTLQDQVKLWEHTTSSYMRIEDHAIFPSLKDTWAIFWEGSYLELQPSPTPITLIPPGQFGPPDKVATLETRTNKPGLVLKDIGKGRLAYLPWHIGQLYYLHSNDKHRLLVSDLVDHLLSGERQLRTDAHPAVEISIMRQEKQDRTLVHLVNLIGHSGTAFFDAVEMRDVSLEIRGKWTRATTLDGQQDLSVTNSGEYTRFILPVLQEYQAVCLYRQ
jgi:hypothetical protein